MSPEAMLQLAIVLLSVVLALAAAARRLPIPYPVVLVLGGLILPFIPGTPRVALNPDVIFNVFLPPILWAAAYESDLRQLRRSALPIAGLAVGLVVLTTFAVAWVAHRTMPGIPWASAFILGAVVSSTDSVAATAVARRLGIPRRLIALLEGESLVNDASALVLFHAAVTARVDGTWSLSEAVTGFFYDAGVGVVVGIAVGAIVYWVGRAIHNTAGAVTLTIMAAYLSWAADERVDASGVLSCVACGLYVRRRMLIRASPAVRLQTAEVWKLLVFMLNGVIFVILGLEWPNLAADLPDGGAGSIWVPIVAVCATVILVRLAWFPLMSFGLRSLLPEERRGPPPDPRWTLLGGWTGMRGIVTLAAALAVPAVTVTGAEIPYRGRIVIIAFCVVVATLVLQGLTLAPLIRRLGLRDDGEEIHEMTLARSVALQAAAAKLDELQRAGQAQPETSAMLRDYYLGVASHMQSLSTLKGDEIREGRRRIDAQRGMVIEAQRVAVLKLWREGRITDQSLAVAERQIDMENLRFSLGGDEDG